MCRTMFLLLFPFVVNQPSLHNQIHYKTDSYTQQNFFTSLSVMRIFVHWLNACSINGESVLTMPITLCASFNCCCAFEVCLIFKTLEQLPSAALSVLLQTIRTGVNAIVMLSCPSCEVVKNKYCSITSSLPTLIYFGSFAVMKMRSPLPNA